MFSLSSYQYRRYCYCCYQCCQQAQYIRHRTRIISCYYWWNHRLYRYAYRLILICKITVINDLVTLCVIQCLKDYQCLSLQLCGIKCEGYLYTSICCLSCKGSFCGYTNRLSACLIHNGSLYHIGLSRRQTLVCYGIH